MAHRQRGHRGKVRQAGAITSDFFGTEVTHDLETFKRGRHVIVAKRWGDELADVADKV